MGVLIVEDDAKTTDWMGRILRRQGHESGCVDSQAEAMIALEARPCCVLLDLALSDGSGLPVLERANVMGIPVAVLSANVEDIPDAVMLKVAGVFTKPVDLDELTSWLRTMCCAGGCDNG
jgi:DNA-binding response OmpR family regulator